LKTNAIMLSVAVLLGGTAAAFALVSSIIVGFVYTKSFYTKLFHVLGLNPALDDGADLMCFFATTITMALVYFCLCMVGRAWFVALQKRG